MSLDPWTGDNPQPGDFDALLATIDPACVEYHSGISSARPRILISVEGEGARRLQRLAEVSGNTPHDVVAKLLRVADGSAEERGRTG